VHGHGVETSAKTVITDCGNTQLRLDDQKKCFSIINTALCERLPFMRFCKDPHRPNLAISPTPRSPPSMQYPSQANASNYDKPYSSPYALEVMSPPQTDTSNLWPYQPATPDTSMARVRSMVELSGRSDFVTSPTTNGNGHLAFPEPQLSRSISHSPTQQFASSSRNGNSSNSIDSHPLGFHRQVSTSSFQSTTSSYWEDTTSEVRLARRHM
jgi:hypothetical protein